MSDDGLIAVVLSTLRKAGWWCARLQSGTAHGGRMKLAPAGSPDVIAIIPRRKLDHVTWWVDATPVMIECKARKGKMREKQLELRAWCETHGVRYVVVRSSEDVATLVLYVWG